MEHKTTVQPLLVRVTHWTNALTFGVMLWSGFAMFAADRKFAWGVHVLPASFWSALHLSDHAAVGRAWHLAFALLLIANGVVYTVGAILTGRWRRVQYQLPQRGAYAGVLMLAALMVVTGLSLWFNREIPWLAGLFGGQRNVLLIHVCSATAFIAFILVHVVQVARAGFPTLVSMLAGTSALRPAAMRRVAFASAASLAVLVGCIVGVRAATAPTGIPEFLSWTQEHRQVRHRRVALYPAAVRSNAHPATTAMGGSRIP